jgi:type II secretory pathway pseudopilin PulG
MRISVKFSGLLGLAVLTAAGKGRHSQKAFTLVEAMVVTLLTVMVIASCIGLCVAMNYNTARQASYTSALSVIEGKLASIQGTAYDPPYAPFTSSTTSITDTNDAIHLSQDGTNFMIPGSVVSTFEPIAFGHLVTVTGTFQFPGQPLTVSIQGIVNKYSAGQAYQQ